MRTGWKQLSRWMMASSFSGKRLEAIHRVSSFSRVSNGRSCWHLELVLRWGFKIISLRSKALHWTQRSDRVHVGSLSLRDGWESRGFLASLSLEICWWTIFLLDDLWRVRAMNRWWNNFPWVNNNGMYGWKETKSAVLLRVQGPTVWRRCITQWLGWNTWLILASAHQNNALLLG